MDKEKVLVLEIIKKFKTNDPFELCDLMNVNVHYANLGTLRGMYRYNKRNCFITLNSALELTYVEYKFICAHELGHLLMHKDYNRIMMDHPGYKPNRYENEANKFAMFLLMESLDEYEREEYNFHQAARHLGIPFELINIL